MIRVDFPFPKHLERLPLGVVVNAGHPNERGVPRVNWRDGAVDEEQALPDRDDLPNQRCGGFSVHSTVTSAVLVRNGGTNSLNV